MARKPADQTVQRDDILQAAAAVFQARGYQGATMADIARQVNLTAGSLYHHFPAGKADLLLAVLNIGLDTVLEEFEAIVQRNHSASETLRHMITSHVLNVTQNVAVSAAMVFEIRNVLDLQENPAGRDAFLARRDKFERYYRQVIERGIAVGEFRAVDAAIYTKALLGAHHWIVVWYRPGGRLSGSEVADRMIDTFLTGLRC